MGLSTELGARANWRSILMTLETYGSILKRSNLKVNQPELLKRDIP
jgi:hypothetical protein